MPEPKTNNVYSQLQNSSNWFSEAVLYFRTLGFYEEFADLSDIELVDKIKTLYEYDKYMAGVKLTRIAQLLLILKEDEKRVWFCDTEVCWDQQYVKFMKEWGKISCGTLHPEDISETRYEDYVKIYFTQNGKSFGIYAHNFGEWLDLGVFGWINDIIRSTKYHFWNIVPDTQEVCMVCLTTEQKEKLENDLGAMFEEPDDFKYNPFPDG